MSKSSLQELSKHLEKNRANTQLSCAPEHNNAESSDAAIRLAAHLRDMSPFHKRWEVTETINAGAFGVVFAVRDIVTKALGVIKVAKTKESGNESLEWEKSMLKRIFTKNPESSVVRLLDCGKLLDPNKEGMEFIVVERLELTVAAYLDSAPTPKERRLRALSIAIQMLKGIHDLHSMGILHRDLKPKNMGLLSVEKPILYLFDLGCARLYTDGVGNIRPPRTITTFRGTIVWASGHAEKGREQNRFDDLMSWLYVVVDLLTPAGTRRLPWHDRNDKETAILKTPFVPARILLRHCPEAFYAMHNYLHHGNRRNAPNYEFLAERVMEAIEQVKRENDLKSNNTSVHKSINKRV